MNYLSHFLLSSPAPDEIQLGNFLGDVINKKSADALPESIKKGIEFHRFVDHFTDNHELVLEGKRLLYPKFGKYSSVILDVYFDFVLIENWGLYAEYTVQEFMENCYQFIDSQMPFVPTEAKNRVEAMNRAKWMNGYLSEQGRLDLFSRLAKRAKFDKNFGEAVHIYAQKHEELKIIHREFFPILVENCSNWLNN